MFNRLFNIEVQLIKPINKPSNVMNSTIIDATVKDLYAAETVYETLEDYLASPVLEDTFKNHSRELERHKALARETEFIRAYKVDKKLVTGSRRTVLFRVFRNRSGMIVVKETTLGSCISSRPMRVVDLFADGFQVTGVTIEKTEANREWLAANDVPVL